MLKLWILFSVAAVGFTHPAGEGPTVAIPISEEAVVKSDRVGNNFAYSIRHEQRSVLPVQASAVAAASPLSAHPVNVPSVNYPTAVAGVGLRSKDASLSSSSSIASAERSSGSAVHQFKSATSQSASSSIAAANSQQTQQLQQQQAQDYQAKQEYQQKQHQQVQDYQQKQHQQVQDYQQQQQVQDYQQQQHQQVQQVQQQQQDQHQQDHHQQDQQQQQDHHHQNQLQQSNSVGQSVSGPVGSPATAVLYTSGYAHQQPLALRTQVVSQPAQVEVVHQAPVGVYAHSPAAVGIFNYPSPTGAALIQGSSSEVVRDTAKVSHHPPTVYLTQVAAAPAAAVYSNPKPAPAFYAPAAALVPAEAFARLEPLKFVDASTSKLADASSLKWVDASGLKWTDGSVFKWTDENADQASRWSGANSALQRFDVGSPLRFAEPAAIKFADSVKYAADGSASKYSSSDSSSTKYNSEIAPGVSSLVIDNKVASDAASSSNAKLATKAAVQQVVKSESANHESGSSESAQSSASRIYAAPAFIAAASSPLHQPQQVYYAESAAVPARRFYTTAGLVHEPTLYAARISHPGAAVYAANPVPVQQTLGPAGIELHAIRDSAAETLFHGYQLPSGGREFHYATARQPTTWVAGVHQASGAASSHESHSQSSSHKVY